MKKKRINGRLPDRIGIYVRKAIIESRWPFDFNRVIPKEINIKKVRVTVIGDSKIENLKPGESFEIMRRKILVGYLKLVGGKCRGTKSHHMFRYKVRNLVILPAS